jgi:peptidoglycan hydrolase-like protein with peptidoglycan-binding domain
MNDPAVKGRIEETQSLWNSANNDGQDAVKERAHLEAEISRADYCVVYPKSPFAYAFLESGGLSNNTAFRRQISYTQPQMYGSDIMAIQRALITYGYLEATDIAFEEYGYYGPTTQSAVNDYQSEVLGINPTGTVANATIGKLFSSGNSSNESQATFGDLNKINVFKMKHDYVLDLTAIQLGISGTTVWKAPNTYLVGGGGGNKRGYPDIIRDGWGAKAVWEVKPDTAYGTSSKTSDQIENYRTASQSTANANRPYCPIIYLGSDIEPFSIQWGVGYSVYVSSTPTAGMKKEGVVYYKDVKDGAPVYYPIRDLSPASEPQPQEDYWRVTMPEPQTVYNGVIAAGIVVAAFYIIKTAIAILAAPETGGASLLLLCW